MKKRKRIVKFLFMALLTLSVLFCVEEKAFAASTDNSESDELVIDVDQEVSITINLEDETRFMGVDFYLIGTYSNGQFQYDDLYESLVDARYTARNDDGERAEDLGVFLKYIKENDVEPTSVMRIRNGKGVIEGLPVGLYIMIQNELDYNAQLKKNNIIEAPTLSSDNTEYMYDIVLFPRWDRTVWFSFRPEVVNPLMSVLILLMCVLMAFFGAKIFRSLILIVAFFISGFVGFKYMSNYISDYLWLMVVFLLLAFVGVGILLFVVSVLTSFLVKRKLINMLTKHLIWITPVLALVISVITLRANISTECLYSICIPVVVAVLGTIYQFFKKNEIRNFYTYDDLIAMEIIDDKEGDTDA